jgi:hypothetical protein
MATRYWVGGSGNWDATSTANWATSSGGASGASAPTATDDVIFDAGSNVGVGTFTVTVTGTSSAPAVCNDFSTGGAGGALDGVMTLSIGATAELHCYGSLTLPATNLTWTGVAGAILYFKSTTTGKTITPNGVTFTLTRLYFDGVGGEWTLGSALVTNASSIFSLNLINGSLATGNFNITAVGFTVGSGTISSFNAGSSTILLSGSTPFTFNTTNLTFNAGTSQITCSGASPAFNGSGLTFYNVSFTSAAAGTVAITGENTYNNLTFTSRSATGQRNVSIGANQTISGTLTLGTTNTAIRRITIFSNTIGTQRTITLNSTLAALADVDFRDINAAGTVATPWTGTRLGNAKNVSNITTDVAKTVYWNLAGSQNWSATGWATTNNGVPAINNFPLPQDTATFTEAGAAGTVTLDAGWWIGSIQMADGVSNRTTAFTLATGTQTPTIYENVTLFTNLVLSGTGNLTFAGQSSTQAITSAAITFTQPITVNAPAGIFELQDALTQNAARAFTLTNGTVKLKAGVTSTVGVFATSGTNQKYLQSTLAGTQATLSQASGTVNASNLTIKDINATGGATWNALWANNNVDEGNNSGWIFGEPPIALATEYTYTIRSFTQPRRF